MCKGYIMSSLITFIDNNIDSGDWCVVILNGEVIHEGHDYPRVTWFVEFFETYQGIPETVEHIGMTDEEIQNWREVLYGEE